MRKQKCSFTECERKCLQNTVRCSRNTFIFLLFHISSFFKDVPHSLSLDRFLFCCCDESTGLVRCLQDFANVLSIANVFAMFAKMFAWFRNLFLRSWVADFLYIFSSYSCENVCENVRKIYFVLYSHPLLALGNRERRLALYCGQY